MEMKENWEEKTGRASVMAREMHWKGGQKNAVRVWENWNAGRRRNEMRRGAGDKLDPL